MRIQRISVQNFKAFKEKEIFEVEEKNLLVFGNNGSGKSSLHYALHVFFQSSIPEKDFNKYFIPTNQSNGEESLLNIYADHSQLPYLIELDIKKNDSINKYQLKDVPEDGAFPSTHQDINLSDFASDFISHRQLFRFYYFRNSQNANIWPLFEKEIFPYWRDDESGKTLDIWLRELKDEFIALSNETTVNTDESGKEQERVKKYNKLSKEYVNVQMKISEFNQAFISLYSSLKDRINEIINQFLPEENLDVELEYKIPLDTDPIYIWLWNKPELNIKLKTNGIEIPKPHVFLNEARLTALALAIRLAMFDNKFKGTGDDVLKLLVLDDLLISLDMDFRMRFIEFLKNSDSFKDYQIIFFTHDKGLFEILKCNLAFDKRKWKNYEFFENNTYPIINNVDYKNPIILENEDFITLAKDYLDGKSKNTNGSISIIKEKNYELCALYLRKKVEQIIKLYFDPGLNELFRFKTLETLERGLGSIEKEWGQKQKKQFEKVFYKKQLNLELFEELKNKSLELPPDISNEKRKEYNDTNILKNSVFDYIIQYHQNFERNEELKKKLIYFSKILQEIRSRILNEGAHANDNPIFELELLGAFEKVKDFENLVKEAVKYNSN